MFEHGILIQNFGFTDNVPAFKAYTVITQSNIGIRELIVTRGMNGLCPFDCGSISQMNAITPKVLYKCSIRFVALKVSCKLKGPDYPIRVLQYERNFVSSCSLFQ